MANTNAPRGLYNARVIGSGGGTPNVQHFHVSSTYASTFYPGMLVAKRGDGFAIILNSTNLFGATFLGVCQSELIPPGNQSGDPVKKVMVITDVRNVAFEIQSTNVAASLLGPNVGDPAGAELIGNNMKFISVTAIDNDRRMSSMRCEPTATNGTATGPLKVIGFPRDKGVDLTAADPRVVVQFNEVSGMLFYQTTGSAAS